MSTTIRPEVSPRSQYWISRHRYYELKHFCFQYREWKYECANFDSVVGGKVEVSHSDTNNISNPVAFCAENREFYVNRIKLIEASAKESCPELAEYIIKGVTEGISYDQLRARYNIPCCKDTYYEVYRRFFWILSRDRQ